MRDGSTLTERLSEGTRRNGNPWQFIRYLLVGCWNTGFGYGVFFLIYSYLKVRLSYTLAYNAANIASQIFAITNAYIGYKCFVFQTRGNYLREYLRFYVVYGVTAIINILLLPVVVTLLSHALHGRAYPLCSIFGKMLILSSDTTPYYASALLLLITVLGSFFGHKHFSFNETDKNKVSGVRCQ